MGGKPVFNTLTGPPTERSQKTFESGRKRGYNVNNSKKMATVFDWDKYYEAVDHGVIPPDLKPVEFSGGNPPLRDWWDDLKILGGPRNKERMGYPTQKPLAVLERIIEASSDPGDVVLDPFCGCATALVAADRLDRQWVGIDLSPLAAKLVNSRLRDDMGLFFDIHHRTDIPHRTDLGTLANYRTHRHTLYGRQEGVCAGCEVMFPFRNMTVDHIVPQSKGDSDHLANLQLLCAACNSTKGVRPQEEFIATLKREGLRR